MSDRPNTSPPPDMPDRRNTPPPPHTSNRGTTSPPHRPNWEEIVRRHLTPRLGDRPAPGGARTFDEVAEEIAQHLEDQYTDALRRGMSPAEAERQVLPADGEWPSLARALLEPDREAPRRSRQGIIESVAQDIRFAARTLASRPLFAGSVILLLAIGIGANSALFTVVNGVLFAPLPFSEPERLMAISEANRRDGGALEASNLKAANLRDLRERSTAIEDVAGYWQGPAVRTGGDEPEQVAVIRTTRNLFAVLGVDAAVGTTFPLQADEAARTVVLDHGYWERRFAADVSAVGTTLTLDGESYIVVGVAPAAFRFLERADLFMVGSGFAPEPPIDLGDDYDDDRSTGYMNGIGRLRAGVSFDSALAELDRIGRDLEDEFPDDQAARTFTAAPLRDSLVGSVEGALLLLLGAVGFVLLIACANVANLLLARAAGRRKEIALRTALGASRARVIRQLLTESSALSLAGGALGTLLAFVAMGPLRGLLPDTLPRSSEIGVDANVLGFTLLISVLTGVVFGIAPALQSAGTDVRSVMRGDARGASAGRSRTRLRDGLVIAEIALASVLLIGAGLMLRSLLALQSRDPGFDPDGVLTLRLALPQAKYDADEKIIGLYWRLVDEIGALPGVDAAATVLGLPFSGTRAGFTYLIDGQEPPPPGQEYGATFQAVSPGYFDAIGIPLLAGRDFTRADSADAPAVVIVNEALVRRHFPDADPLTQALDLGDDDPVPIVGVVGSTRHLGYDTEVGPEVYLTFEQMTFPLTSVVVHTSGSPEDLVPSVRRKVFEIDPDQPVYRVQTLRGLMADTVSQPRFNSGLLAAFAGAALVLAGIGVFSVISYSVTQRTRELGIRIALGADTRVVAAMVMRQGGALVALGIVTGVAAAAGVSRLVNDLWFGVSAVDPVVFLAVPGILAAVSLLATYVPVRRATRVDPVVALRSE